MALMHLEFRNCVAIIRPGTICNHISLCTAQLKNCFKSEEFVIETRKGPCSPNAKIAFFIHNIKRNMVFTNVEPIQETYMHSYIFLFE